MPPPLAPPPILEAPAPARTGATLLPDIGATPEPPPPSVPPPVAPIGLDVVPPVGDTREPAASLDPIAHASAGYPAPVQTDPPGWTPATPVPFVDAAMPAEPPPPPPPVEEPPPVALAPAEPMPSTPSGIAQAAEIAPTRSERTPRGIGPSPSEPPRTPTPHRSSPSRPPGVPQVIPAPSAPPVRSNPSASPVFIDPRHVDSLDIDFTDLASLSGSALSRAACARVFAAVFDTLCAGEDLPARDGETRARARSEAVRLLQVAADAVNGIEVRPWAERIASEMCGLGALSARLAETDVQEIFVHGPERVLVRRGNTPPSEIDAKFSCPQAIEVVVRRLTGTNFGAENPIVDARTLDGADVYAVHESVASGGPVVNITLPSPTEPRWTLELLLQEGALSPAVANLLSVCVQAGLGILVCAGPGARAFPLVTALVDAAPSSDRHVIVRPMAEPGLLPAHVVVLEGDGLVGTDGTTVMQALVRTAVGLRPDRLCLHETTGPEASDLLAAAGRGLSGVLVSMRASTAEAGLQRLAALTGSAGGPDNQSRMQAVARTLELIVTIGRFPDGTSRVVEVAEARVAADGTATTTEIIGIDPRTGTWRHTGAVPNFFGAMQRRGIVVDAAMLGG
jgi:pilus assembly protein CpaF